MQQSRQKRARIDAALNGTALPEEMDAISGEQIKLNKVNRMGTKDWAALVEAGVLTEAEAETKRKAEEDKAAADAKAAEDAQAAKDKEED